MFIFISVQPSILFFSPYGNIHWYFRNAPQHSIAHVKNDKCQLVLELYPVFWHCKIPGAAADAEEAATSRIML